MNRSSCGCKSSSVGMANRRSSCPPIRTNTGAGLLLPLGASERNLAVNPRVRAGLTIACLGWAGGVVLALPPSLRLRGNAARELRYFWCSFCSRAGPLVIWGIGRRPKGVVRPSKGPARVSRHHPHQLDSRRQDHQQPPRCRLVTLRRDCAGPRWPWVAGGH